MDNNIFIGKNIYTKFFMEIIRHNPKIAPYLFYMHKRARIKYNLQCVIGEQGSGKSIYEIVQFLCLDPTFDLERIIFSSINLLDTLDLLEDRAMVGRCILWDDAGVGLPSDEWFSISNKAIHSVTQTIRTLHPTLGFTVPNMEYIDKKTRMVFSSILDCRRDMETETDIRAYTAKRIKLISDIVYRKFCYQQGVAKIRYGEIKIKHFEQHWLKDFYIFKEYIRISDKFKFDSRKKAKELMLTMQTNKLGSRVIEDYTTLTLSDFEKRLLYETFYRVFNEPRNYLNKSRKLDEQQIKFDFKVDSRIARTVKRYFDAQATPQEVKSDLGIEEPRAVEESSDTESMFSEE